MPWYLSLALLLVASLSVKTASAQNIDPSQRFAVLVGISDYPGDDGDLAGGPLNDVALMADLLVSRLGFPRGNLLVLADEDATWFNIVQAFRSHLSRAGKDGVALFYYSGHGAQLPNVGVDSESDDLDEVLVTLGPTPGTVTMVRDEDLGRLTSILPTDRVLIVLDNCYSGTGTRGARGSVRWRDIGRGLVLPPAVQKTTVSGLRPSSKRLTPTAIGEMRAVQPSGIEVPGDSTEPVTHVLLAASAEHEISLNAPFILDDGTLVRIGAFTAALYTTLNRVDMSSTSFSALATSLQAVTRQLAARLGEAPQTPQAEGARRDAFIGPFLGLP